MTSLSWDLGRRDYELAKECAEAGAQTIFFILEGSGQKTVLVESSATNKRLELASG